MARIIGGLLSFSEYFMRLFDYIIKWTNCQYIFYFFLINIFASKNTVDIYNPKVVQATMGALARVRVHYVDLPFELSKIDAPIYVTALDGDNINKSSLTKNGVIVMGNEGNGVSAEVMALANKKLLIPSYPPERPTSESLNVSVATAIVVSMFRSQI